MACLRVVRLLQSSQCSIEWLVLFVEEGVYVTLLLMEVRWGRFNIVKKRDENMKYYPRRQYMRPTVPQLTKVAISAIRHAFLKPSYFQSVHDFAFHLHSGICYKSYHNYFPYHQSRRKCLTVVVCLRNLQQTLHMFHLAAFCAQLIHFQVQPEIREQLKKLSFANII